MNAKNEACPIEFLLIEDDPDDVWETRRMFSENKLANRLHVVNDGEEALAFLQRSGRFADAPRPDLILLDLNLPKRDGRELLGDINNDESLRDIPVVVLTTSQAVEDIVKARDLHCHSYIGKPVRIDHLIMLVKSIDGFSTAIMKGMEPPSQE